MGAVSRGGGGGGRCPPGGVATREAGGHRGRGSGSWVLLWGELSGRGVSGEGSLRSGAAGAAAVEGSLRGAAVSHAGMLSPRARSPLGGSSARL